MLFVDKGKSREMGLGTSITQNSVLYTDKVRGATSISMVFKARGQMRSSRRPTIHRGKERSHPSGAYTWRGQEEKRIRRLRRRHSEGLNNQENILKAK